MVLANVKWLEGLERDSYTRIFTSSGAQTPHEQKPGHQVSKSLNITKANVIKSSHLKTKAPKKSKTEVTQNLQEARIG